jgi:hypothetical protein
MRAQLQGGQYPANPGRRWWTVPAGGAFGHMLDYSVRQYYNEGRIERRPYQFSAA